MARQLSLPIPNGWGGKRAGAGRKPRGRRAGVRHEARPVHDKNHPLHITLRVGRGLGSLRGYRASLAIEGAVGAGSSERFRVVHYSVQEDHIHLICEASDRAAVMRGAKGLSVRLARAINRVMARRGQVFCDRYHTRAVTMPLEMRKLLVYVLLNVAKHSGQRLGVDRDCSSGMFFDGWRQHVVRPIGPAPVARPRTWLAARGWRRHGPISVNEAPG
jgi:hypothetical protein